MRRSAGPTPASSSAALTAPRTGTLRLSKRGQEEHLLSVAWALSVSLLTAGLVAQAVAAGGNTLSFDVAEKRTFQLPGSPYGAVTRSVSGELYFLSTQQNTLVRVPADGGEARETSLETIPELRTPGAQLVNDLAVDRSGHAYVAATWRTEAGDRVAAVFVLDSSGAYRRMIRLEPFVTVHSIAVSGAGEVFVAGMDPAFFRRRIRDCLLVHSYSAAGQRLRSFSACPEVLMRGPASAPGWARAKEFDVDRGRVWVKDDSVYHVLPGSRRLRVFSVEGQLEREVTLQPPPSLPERWLHGATAGDVIWRLLALPDGRFLAQWRHSRGGGGVTNVFTYLSLHDPQGRAMVAATPAPWSRSWPVDAEPDGGVLWIHNVSADTDKGERSEIIRTRLGLR